MEGLSMFVYHLWRTLILSCLASSVLKTFIYSVQFVVVQAGGKSGPVTSSWLEVGVHGVLWSVESCHLTQNLYLNSTFTNARLSLLPLHECCCTTSSGQFALIT